MFSSMYRRVCDCSQLRRFWLCRHTQPVTDSLCWLSPAFPYKHFPFLEKGQYAVGEKSKAWKWKVGKRGSNPPISLLHEHKCISDIFQSAQRGREISGTVACVVCVGGFTVFLYYTVFNSVYSVSCSKCGTLPPESCFFSLICSTGSFMGKASCADTDLTHTDTHTMSQLLISTSTSARTHPISDRIFPLSKEVIILGLQLLIKTDLIIHYSADYLINRLFCL